MYENQTVAIVHISLIGHSLEFRSDITTVVLLQIDFDVDASKTATLCVTHCSTFHTNMKAETGKFQMSKILIIKSTELLMINVLEIENFRQSFLQC